MQQPVVRVGEWLVTPSINQISRNGRQLTLEPRLIDLLVFFAQHSGEVLSRDELIDNVWKRSIVTNHVVTQSISELRKSLKDNDEDSPVYIATVPKRGYKLMVPVIWYSEEEGEEIMLSSPPPIPEAVPDTDSPSHSLKEGANKRGNSSRLTQSFHFFMFEPIFSPVNALNQPI
ncbi:hypothetical protein WEK_04743 [Escherichia coli KTE26]|nr:hypothetical protein WEK_04743 [Escherichia coli KTE26]